MRCEVLKQANEAEEGNLHLKHTRFMDHVAKLEAQLGTVSTQGLSHAQSLPTEVKMLTKRNKDFKPLKTKAFQFEQQTRQMSAQETYGPNR